jgi:TonB family protein
MSILVIALAASLCQAPEEPKSQPQEPTPLRVRRADEITQPKLIKRSKPDYPEEALRGGLYGDVVLEVEVDTKGRVKEAKVLKGDPPLSDAAVEAVKKWLYKPLLLNGEATGFVLIVTINFGTRERGERKLRFDDLIASLRSKHEAVRESAAGWLGGLRGQMNPRSVYVAFEALRSLLEHEESERVRAAATRALAELARK